MEDVLANRGYLNRNQIKYIVIIAMLIDHTAGFFMPSIHLFVHVCTLSDGLPGQQWLILSEKAIPIPKMSVNIKKDWLFSHLFPGRHLYILNLALYFFILKTGLFY